MRCVILAAAAALVAGYTPAQGELRLVFRWDGDLPPSPALEFPPGFQELQPTDAEVCGRCRDQGKLRDERLVVDEKTRGIRDVAVTIPDLKDVTRPPLPPLVLDNQDCRFVPRVAFVAVGAAITVKNSDPLTHNARLNGRGGRQFWNGLLAGSSETASPPLAAPGLYTVSCDVHPWMQAWIIATRSPWSAVTGSDGQVAFAGIPKAESVRVFVWHPTLGEARVDLPVTDGQVTERVLSQKDFGRK